MEKTKENVPATRGSFAADAGGGMEEATSDSFAIPFLTVLQKGSPQVDEASGQQIPGAKAGMIYETVTKTVFDGNQGVEFVQAHFKRTWLRWGARDAGGGFKGEIAPEVLLKMQDNGQIVNIKGISLIADKNGEADLDESDRLVDTRVHYVLLINREKKTTKRCVLSLSRTQVRKSRNLMSKFADYRAEENGQQYQPPTYQHIVKMATVPEKNDQGTWYGVDFDLVGLIEDPTDPFYLDAKQFKEAVRSGIATAKMGADGAED